MTPGDPIKLYAASIRELDDAQHAYMAKPDEDTFTRFWTARERYQTLTQWLDQGMKLNDAQQAYRKNGS